MSHEDHINCHQAFVFKLDDVLYPEKDYWLQVYYLFAQFIEYSEQTEGKEILLFMEETYRKEGNAGIFVKTAVRFGLPEKYQINFDLLQQNARLPLKLLLFAPVLKFLQAISTAGKPVFLLAEGDSAAQLNKIRQIEWNGLEQNLKVYFTAEMADSIPETLKKITLEHDLKSEEVLVIGKPGEQPDLAYFNTFPFLPSDNIT